MRQHGTNILLAMAAILPAIAVSATWFGTRWAGRTEWQMTVSLTAAALIVASVAASMLMARSLRSQSASMRYLELLCRADVNEVRNSNALQVLDDLPKESPWLAVYEQVKQRIIDLNERLEEKEIRQAEIDVRINRWAREHEKISIILNNLTEAVFAIDRYDEIILVNPKAAELFGIDIESDEKRKFADICRNDAVIELLTETRRRKAFNQRTAEVEFTAASGKSKWFHVTARTLMTNDGNVGEETHGVVAIFRDISGQKQIQKRHAEFVSAVSHEMKTPLAAIKAYVELLADGEAEDEETRDEFLSIVDSQADRLRRLVDNLLNIARIEAGVVNVQKHDQSLNELLDQVLDLMTPAAEEKQITLVNDLSPMYLGVFVDHDMLLQAALNLTSNAIKYTRPGRKVTLRSRLVDNRVEFEVEDEGVGLSTEDQQKVFEKFYRVTKDKSMASGTGLGLPLAKHIVEDVHQGRLLLKSQLGVGSTLTVQLPAARQINRPENGASSPELAGSL